MIRIRTRTVGREPGKNTIRHDPHHQRMTSSCASALAVDSHPELSFKNTIYKRRKLCHVRNGMLYGDPSIIGTWISLSIQDPSQTKACFRKYQASLVVDMSEPGMLGLCPMELWIGSILCFLCNKCLGYFSAANHFEDVPEMTAHRAARMINQGTSANVQRSLGKAP